MIISVSKITGNYLLHFANEITTRKTSRMKLDEAYKREHSPIRTQLFWIAMYGIPTYVSVHLVRHKIGVEHFVSSNRPDRGGDGNADRNSPVDHGMFINAAALIYISRKRLCGCSAAGTIEVWEAIKKEIEREDPDLARYMVQECRYRNGICPEAQRCERYMKEV